MSGFNLFALVVIFALSFGLSLRIGIICNPRAFTASFKKGKMRWVEDETNGNSATVEYHLVKDRLIADYFQLVMFLAPVVATFVLSANLWHTMSKEPAGIIPLITVIAIGVLAGFLVGLFPASNAAVFKENRTAMQAYMEDGMLTETISTYLESQKGKITDSDGTLHKYSDLEILPRQANEPQKVRFLLGGA